MSENLRKYTQAVYMLDAVAARVPDGAWDNQSCCEGWSARQVAGHAAWLIKNVGSLAAGQGSIAEQAEAEVLGPNPSAGFREIARTTFAQLDQPGALPRVAATPFGEMPIDNLIGIVWVDALTHAWDVADATGIAHGINEASAQAAFDQMEPMLDRLRGPGMFADAQSPSGDDAVSRFIALSGRSSVQ